MSNFFDLSPEKRKAKYDKLYVKQNKSWAQIAKELGVSYPNKVRRDAKRLGCVSRNKSEAQKIAIKEGRHEHPTKGKKRTLETKIKISESQGKIWDNLSEQEREYRAQIGLESWNKKTDAERAEFLKKGSEAVQRASKTGSKVETYVFEFLTKKGYRVDRHKEQVLQNEKLHLDLYIPACRLAIEIDGPLHFKPVFGEEKLKKRQAADLIKNGLVLNAGMALVRVKLTKRESQRYLRYLTDCIMDIIKLVETKFPNDKNERFFQI